MTYFFVPVIVLKVFPYHYTLILQIKKWHKKRGDSAPGNVRTSGFLNFCQRVDIGDPGTGVTGGRRGRDVKLCAMWKGLSQKEKDKLAEHSHTCQCCLVKLYLKCCRMEKNYYN